MRRIARDAAQDVVGERCLERESTNESGASRSWRGGHDSAVGEKRGDVDLSTEQRERLAARIAEADVLEIT